MATVDSGRDLLRRERFGAMYYRRATASFFAVPSHQARLLFVALSANLIEEYAACGSGLFAGGDIELACIVARWRSLGFVDENYRCRARFVDYMDPEVPLSAPQVTHFVLNRACNLRCAHCYQRADREDRRELTTAEIVAVFGELRALGAPLVVLTGGEPLLRNDIVALCGGLGDHDLDGWLCTNGTLMTPSLARALAETGLRGVNVSLDGPDAESHEAIRGAHSFTAALHGVRAAIAAGIPEVKIRVTVTPVSLHRLIAFAPLCADLGVHKVVFKPFSAVGTASRAGHLEVSRVQWEDAACAAMDQWPADAPPAEFAAGSPSRWPREDGWTGVWGDFDCVAGRSIVSIMPDGAVVGCDGYLRDDDWRIQDHRFLECWRQAPGLKFWRALQPGPTCARCSELATCGGGCHVRALSAGRNLDEPDPWSCRLETVFEPGSPT